jgi:sugar/nucleoside kinase (ribokinase family)
MTPPRVLFVGRTTLDVLYWLDRLPAEDTKTYARQFHAAPGGPALNAAVTHALLGGESMLISAVGGGPWAAAVRDELARLGIRLLDLAAGTDYETPLCTAWVNAANSTRTVVNPPLSRVALPKLAASWAKAIPAARGPVPPVVLTDGFHLQETLPLLAACKAAGASICLDGGSWKPGTDELAPLLTTAICSERFTLPGQPSGPESIFAWFAAQGVPQIAVTRGPRSILGSDRGRRFEIEIELIEAQDTLGAGDVLHGAFCHHFAGKGNFEAALRQAARIATLSCQSHGVQSWAAQLRKAAPSDSLSPRG